MSDGETATGEPGYEVHPDNAGTYVGMTLVLLGGMAHAHYALGGVAVSPALAAVLVALTVGLVLTHEGVHVAALSGCGATPRIGWRHLLTAPADGAVTRRQLLVAQAAPNVALLPLAAVGLEVAAGASQRLLAVYAATLLTMLAVRDFAVWLAAYRAPAGSRIGVALEDRVVLTVRPGDAAG